MTLESDVSVGVWRDRAAPVAERVADLMGRMSVRERVAQLYGVWVHVEESAGRVAPRGHESVGDGLDWDDLMQHGIGQLTRVYGTTPVAPAEGARRLAALQRQILAAGRFRIPAVIHEECLTGVGTWQATVYPSPLCWGASFDPDLVEQMGAQIGALMRRLGVQQALSPVLDVVRDLRWGRVEEAIGEDPHLVGTIGAAYVRGMQAAGVVATLKHFVGHSASRGGRNLAPVSVGPREVADVLLPPFEMAVRAGAGSVMNAYVDLDGVPVAADDRLLTGLLRDRLGFTGTVVSDYFAVIFLAEMHGVAAGRADAAALALEAGIDVELPSVDCYGQPLIDAVESGRLDMSTVDQAVARVLTQKCELGLLDPDWSPEPPILAEPAPVVDGGPARALARRLAERSVVLLRNEGALPLRPAQRLAVVGPGADDPNMMLGCYAFPRHVGVHHPDVPMGVAIPSVLEALRADPAGYQIEHALGCPVLGGGDADIAAAVAAAAGADVCVAVLGDLAGLFGVGTSGEGCDATDLRLPGRQAELLGALLDTGTPVVLVLLAGRPYELSGHADRLAAALCGFFPGEEGGTALAGILSGRVNPSGRLPVSFPASGSTQPATYRTARLGGPSDVSNLDPTPLFPFGHGLSYAPATWLDVSLRTPPAWPTDGSCEIAATLRNDAGIATSEVVQVYLHDPVAEVARPVRQLVAAARMDLGPGEARTVAIALHADLTSYTGRDGRRRIDDGAVHLHVGTSSADIHTTLRLTLTGGPRIVGADRVLEPRITLLPAV